MAGIALRANCTESDINELAKVINGQYREGVKKRAKCIILSSQGILNKDIAVEVGLTPRLVGNWVRRYNSEGINGIFDIPKPGRGGAKQANGDLVDRIRMKMSENPPQGLEAWTAQSLAEGLGVSVYVIWRVCRDNNITLQRPRSWNYDTYDELSSKTIDVVGLFCTTKEKAIVIRVNRENDHAPLCGRFQTHSKDMAAEIETLQKQKEKNGNPEQNVSLAEILSIASERAGDQRRFKGMFLYEFLNDLTEELPEARTCNYMIISYSKAANAFHGLDKPGYSFTLAHSNEEWLHRTETILKTQCNTSDEDIKLTKELGQYVRSMRETTEPFVWWKRPVDINETTNREIIEPRQETDTQGESVITTEPSQSKRERKPKVEIQFSYTDEKGNVTAQTVSVTEGLLCTSECDLKSIESITSFAENLTTHTLPLLDLAGQKIGSFALEQVKKNSV